MKNYLHKKAEKLVISFIRKLELSNKLGKKIKLLDSNSFKYAELVLISFSESEVFLF